MESVMPVDGKMICSFMEKERERPARGWMTDRMMARAQQVELWRRAAARPQRRGPA
jgi:hypothetical protein